MATETSETIYTRVNITIEKRHVKELRERGMNRSLFIRGLIDRYLEDHPNGTI